jgi:pimeloyl-ACP methyl ester carboxylesterase
MLEQEKQININGLNINYKQIGNGDVLIILLHGWGVSSDKYSALAEYLSQFSIFNFQFSIFIPDLPGFGKSEEPKEDWIMDDYVEFADRFIEKASRKSGFELVKNLLKKFNPKNLTSQLLIEQTPQPPLSGGRDNKKIILIGHSFGGRIAIKYAVKYPEKIDKLILTGAAGIKHKLNVKQKVFYILAKAGKKVFSILQEAKLPIGSLASNGQEFLYKLAREKDYYQASPRMKEIMKNVLAEDLTPVLEKIKTSTLLAWGANDNSTPLSDGKVMNEKIKNSELIVIDGANHSLPYQRSEEFAKVVSVFIKK